MITSTSAITILIGAAIALFVVVRQFARRQVTITSMLLGPLVVGVLAVTNSNGLTIDTMPLLAANAAIAFALGVWRGATFKLVRDARGTVVSQATMVTFVLWIALIALRVALAFGERQLGFDLASSSALILIPVAMTLAGQNALIWLRAQNVTLATA